MEESFDDINNVQKQISKTTNIMQQNMKLIVEHNNKLEIIEQNSDEQNYDEQNSDEQMGHYSNFKKRIYCDKLVTYLPLIVIILLIIASIIILIIFKPKS